MQHTTYIAHNPYKTQHKQKEQITKMLLRNPYSLKKS